MTLCHWLTNWYWFNDAQLYILIQACLDCILPVYWYGYRSMVHYWFCIRLDHKMKRFCVHYWKLLMFAGVKCTETVVLHQPILERFTVVGSCRERKLCWF